MMLHVQPPQQVLRLFVSANQHSFNLIVIIYNRAAANDYFHWYHFTIRLIKDLSMLYKEVIN